MRSAKQMQGTRKPGNGTGKAASWRICRLKGPQELMQSKPSTWLQRGSGAFEMKVSKHAAPSNGYECYT